MRRWKEPNVRAVLAMAALAFLIALMLSFSGCAPTEAPLGTPQPNALDYACATYAANLEAAADYIRAGALTDGEIAQVNGLRAVVSPICSELDNVAPEDAASSLSAVRRAILQLQAMGTV